MAEQRVAQQLVEVSADGQAVSAVASQSVVEVSVDGQTASVRSMQMVFEVSTQLEITGDVAATMPKLASNAWGEQPSVTGDVAATMEPVSVAAAGGYAVTGKISAVIKHLRTESEGSFGNGYADATMPSMRTSISGKLRINGAVYEGLYFPPPEDQHAIDFAHMSLSCHTRAGIIEPRRIAYPELVIEVNVGEDEYDFMGAPLCSGYAVPEYMSGQVYITPIISDTMEEAGKNYVY